LNMISKIKTYFTESYNELKKVNWPTKSETVNLTLIVIGFSLVVALFLGLLDILFSYILSQVVL
jgi:preprotein translocase subunit SecE